MVVVEVNGYTIEPGANLSSAGLYGANLEGANLNWIRGKIDLEPVYRQVGRLITHLSD